MQTESMKFINQFWDEEIIPTLMEYIKIPNKSPQFDARWEEHGYMDQAVTLLSNWAKKHAMPNMKIEVIQLEHRTPIILVEAPGESEETILLYGHLDKQPEMSGWDEDLHPWQPVLREHQLFGRGGADDGYALFAALTALKFLDQNKIPRARCLILIEASEESGSPDLPFYIDALAERIKKPALVVCLDSGCGNYEQLWVTTSLRGLVGGTLKINVLKQGIHSGMGSGIVPSCFRILRQLLNRIEDENTGDICLADLQMDIPSIREEQAALAAKALGKHVYSELPFLKDVLPDTANISDLILRRTWKPALSITGCDGFPALENAGNVTLPNLAVKLSMRLSPTCDPKQAAATIKKTLETKPPYNAHVEFEISDTGPGWNAPTEKSWLAEAIQKASHTYFGRDAAYMGEGGSIPFMGMLGKKFPEAQFLITGVLGPQSNAHGPNEFLHIPMAKKLTGCVADVIAEQYFQSHGSSL